MEMVSFLEPAFSEKAGFFYPTAKAHIRIDYTRDTAKRLTNVGAMSYTWDDNGNLLNDGVYTNTYLYSCAD